MSISVELLDNAREKRYVVLESSNGEFFVGKDYYKMCEKYFSNGQRNIIKYKK